MLKYWPKHLNGYDVSEFMVTAVENPRIGYIAEDVC